jgi:exopolyphosphatase/pppGpp-phosphohydrolase
VGAELPNSQCIWRALRFSRRRKKLFISAQFMITKISKKLKNQEARKLLGFLQTQYEKDLLQRNRREATNEMGENFRHNHSYELIRNSDRREHYECEKLYVRNQQHVHSPKIKISIWTRESNNIKGNIQ